ncbi:MAG: hypothetical protein ABL912_11335 [Novosphingobium sp.]
MFKSLMYLALGLAMAGGAQASSKTPRLEGMQYDQARTIILGYGWRPLIGRCGGGVADSGICSRYPETGYCTLTGFGYCTMVFIRGKKCLTLLTVGGPMFDRRSETTVKDVTFSRAPCSKNND